MARYSVTASTADGTYLPMKKLAFSEALLYANGDFIRRHLIPLPMDGHIDVMQSNSLIDHVFASGL